MTFSLITIPFIVSHNTCLYLIVVPKYISRVGTTNTLSVKNKVPF